MSATLAVMTGAALTGAYAQSQAASAQSGTIAAGIQLSDQFAGELFEKGQDINRPFSEAATSSGILDQYLQRVLDPRITQSTELIKDDFLSSNAKAKAASGKLKSGQNLKDISKGLQQITDRESKIQFGRRLDAANLGAGLARGAGDLGQRTAQNISATAMGGAQTAGALQVSGANQLATNLQAGAALYKEVAA